MEPRQSAARARRAFLNGWKGTANRAIVSRQPLQNGDARRRRLHRMMSDRRDQLTRFYAILDVLERQIGGQRTLENCSGRLPWPRRGVYFFRENGESRTDTGSGPRIVRVGTHALKAGSGTRLWTRLSQHRGKNAGGGNHRGSIFRLIVGASLIARDSLDVPTWGRGNAATREMWMLRTISSGQ